MQTVVRLTRFILIPEDTGKPLGNLQKLARVSNDTFLSTGSRHYVIRECRQATPAWDPIGANVKPL